jgi:selenocysteine lyase/cysteine desulfurase
VAGGPETLGSRRDDFDVPPGVAYFNTANLSPLTHRVREAGEQALERRARPWTIAAADWFSEVETLRGLLAELVAADAEGIALVPATSYGFGVAARNTELRPGDRILALEAEYPSGIHTWRAACRERGAELVLVPREQGTPLAEPLLAAIDERVRIVSVPNVHWTDGALVDLERVADRARDAGCRLVIDASQSAGAMPLDLSRLRPNYLVGVGYKWLLGAFGLSYLYVAPEHRDGRPLEENWINRAGAEDFAALVDYTDEYAPGARRFDMGQRSSFHLVPMVIAALRQILDWRVERIAATLAETTAQIAAGLRALGLEPATPEARGPHMLGVPLPEPARARVAEELARVDCFAALRGDSLRIAPHLHNTGEEVERLCAAVGAALDGAG